MKDQELALSMMVLSFSLAGLGFAAMILHLRRFTGEEGKCLMTDEEFVKKWLRTKVGQDFKLRYPEYHAQLIKSLQQPPLPIVDPAEGTGSCACGKLTPGYDVRFGISPQNYMSICPKCNSWGLFPFTFFGGKKNA